MKLRRRGGAFFLGIRPPNLACAFLSFSRAGLLSSARFAMRSALSCRSLSSRVASLSAIRSFASLRFLAPFLATVLTHWVFHFFKPSQYEYFYPLSNQ